MLTALTSFLHIGGPIDFFDIVFVGVPIAFLGMLLIDWAVSKRHKEAEREPSQ